MSFALWDASLSVGNKLIDEHHQHLIMLLNQLYEQVKTGNITASAEKIIDELTDYATYHFAAEEQYMRTYKYPQMDSHAKEHLEFTKIIVEYQKTLVSGQKVLFSNLVVFLKDWLINHICTVDLKLGQFINSNGVS